MNGIKKVIFDLVKYPKIKVEKIFTPSTAAEINYIERPDIDKQLSSEMSIPGKQIIVFGPSGSGKTSSVRNLLIKNKYKFIRTHCESSTTFEQLILNAFDGLDEFVVSGRTNKQSSSIKGDLASEYNGIKDCIGVARTEEESINYSRLLPPQLTPQKLSQFMGKSGIVWLIEDFHKVTQKEKVRIADVIKIFVDNANDYPKSKIICIGACQSAHDLIQLDPNLRTRVSEVYVPLLNDKEIGKIITDGFELLNVSPSQPLVEDLVYYSDRIGSLAHQMCLDICKGESIAQTCLKNKVINRNAFQHAVKGFIDGHADTFKTVYEAVVKNELGKYILKAFSGDNVEKLSYDEICKKVNKKGKIEFSAEDIGNRLKELMMPDYDIIYYDKNSEKYALTTPFWHRFLKMQFDIESNEQQSRKKQSKKRNKRYSDKNTKYYMVDESMLDLIKKIESRRPYQKDDFKQSYLLGI